MAATNNERVGAALDLLKEGLYPFVERQLRTAYKDKWSQEAVGSLRDTRNIGNAEAPTFDVQALLNVMWEHWRNAFESALGHYERSLVSQIREMRNRWAHQTVFSTDDAYRALDQIAQLLTAISAPQAAEVDRQKQELLRRRYEEQAARERRQAAVAPVEGKPKEGLRPWRELVLPHPDVATGRYQQAEFAADLGQVHRGEGSSEYRDPEEFFRRTFLTAGLTHLLASAVLRLTGTGGDPVVELQTNFGGGKTHSMLALYHLFSGVEAAKLDGLDTVLTLAKIESPTLPPATRAVLVGTAYSPGQTHCTSDGTEIHTLWGELAWQLGGKEGYAQVAAADRTGVSPGSAVLLDLFTAHAPCLILIDEWVAFVRQLYGVDGLPAGSFDANLTFAQALTEAARQAPQTLLVASIPASDIEVGGEGGKEALARLKNTFARMESAWRPASADEGFEIVRRRLFQPITDPKEAVSRDAVAKAFVQMYAANTGDFPSESRELNYERRIKAAYPIHPELFDRLYTDWSTLERFQRTRGVLRLMAAVIYTLWQRSDGGLLIMSGSVPIDEQSVQFELTRYLEDQWVPVIETDVDGPNALPLRLDQENPNLGRFSASRRVARTLYMGSAPTLHAANRGLDDRSIKLGCVQPGEAVATFGDALRRLADQAKYLYQHGTRYWFATQPSVTRLAEDRAQQQLADVVHEEVRGRLREEAKTRGDFAAVHPCPSSSGDVPDEPELRLVIIDPAAAYSAKTEENAAGTQARQFLDQRGNSPRRYRNMVVFLAADQARLVELESAVRQFLAWKSISAERTTLNLDTHQSSQVDSRLKQADDTIKQRIPETYSWLLVPEQEPTGRVNWRVERLRDTRALVARVSSKLVSTDALITAYAPTLLRAQLDKIPLWRGDHVGVRQLWEFFTQYLYLPRLKNSDVLLTSIRTGLGLLTWQNETFAYAEGWDDQQQRYRGLKTGEAVTPLLDGSSVLVKPDAALRQLDAENAAQTTATTTPSTSVYVGTTSQGDALRDSSLDGMTVGNTGTATGSPSKPTVGTAPMPHRFHGSVALDAAKITSKVSEISREVLQYLISQHGVDAQITLEISITLPQGASEEVVRTVTENCRTLRFESSGFEQE